MAMEITFLGTGTSQGIPVIACDCDVCRSTDPRDNRMRSSILVHLAGQNNQSQDVDILIDATPELRLQCIKNNVRRVDVCLITHTHADHILGLDDLRGFNQANNQLIDLYIAQQHYSSLEKVFGYAKIDPATPITQQNFDWPRLVFHSIDPKNNPITICGHTICPLTLQHGKTTSTGYRIGPMAYCTDFNHMPENIIQQLNGLEILILGALRPEPHPAHLSLNQAIELAHRIGADKTYFTHISHHISHPQQELRMPANIMLAYDGLKIAI
jgi:phosphoribosyl 1,2-cyclic phosphate phosphodiesterase